MKRIFHAFICFACLAAMVAWSSTGLCAQQDQKGKLSKQELSFMKKAAAANVWELKAGKVAEKRANTPDVKKFGEEMVNEYSEASNRLLAIAKMKGIDLPQQMDQRHQKLYQKLQKTKEFDIEFMKTMIQDFKHRLYEMEKEESKINDPELKEWIKKTIPELQLEIASAEEILKKLYFARKHS